MSSIRSLQAAAAAGPLNRRDNGRLIAGRSQEHSHNVSTLLRKPPKIIDLDQPSLVIPCRETSANSVPAGNANPSGSRPPIMSSSYSYVSPFAASFRSRNHIASCTTPWRSQDGPLRSLTNIPG